MALLILTQSLLVIVEPMANVLDKLSISLDVKRNQQVAQSTGVASFASFSIFHLEPNSIR